jgi:hypothetical protein
MHISPQDLTDQLEALLARRGIAHAAEIAWATAWLEGCGYPGVLQLVEALGDRTTTLTLERDMIGYDLHDVSCAYLAPAIMEEVAKTGRAYLHNVRHGLFVLPFTVRANVGIGCPVDAAFAVGGERLKNPYAEKLALAEVNGLIVDDALWAKLTG